MLHWKRLMDFRRKPPKRFRPVDKLSKEDAENEIEALRDGIHYHDYRYYVRNEPRISDRAYDRLLERLEALEGAFPGLRSENSPTMRVGAAPVSRLRKRGTARAC